MCLELDTDLRSFCQTKGFQFTRYADDLTFSSDSVISDDDVLDIINLIKKNGFEINQKKLRLKSSNRKQTVTGLIVNQKVNVERKLLKKIRAMLHDLTQNGIDSATERHFNLQGNIDPKYRVKFINKLGGYIDFVGQVRGKNDLFYIKMKSTFDEVFSEL